MFEGDCDCSCHNGFSIHSSGSCGSGCQGSGYWSDRGFNSTPYHTVQTALGPISGMHHAAPNKDGGTHHTIYNTSGERYSWDTNSSGYYVSGSGHIQPEKLK